MTAPYWLDDLEEHELRKYRPHVQWQPCATSTPWMSPMETVPDRLISEAILLVYEQCGERHVCTGVSTYQDGVVRWYRHDRDELERPLLWAPTYDLLQAAEAVLESLPGGP